VVNIHFRYLNYLWESRGSYSEAIVLTLTLSLTCNYRPISHCYDDEYMYLKWMFATFAYTAPKVWINLPLPYVYFFKLHV